MNNICDICGFHHGSADRFCGWCNVDLREVKMPGEQKPNPKKNWNPDEKEKTAPKKKPPSDEKIIHWHTIRAICNSYDLDFPLFLNLIIIFARGEKKLGFCDCSSCNRGYRELQAWIINGIEKKKLTANSREVVIKSSYDKIDGMTYDISDFLRRYGEASNEKSSEQSESPAKKVHSGKITIEIDSDVLETAVFNVLKSEKGREIIRSTPRRKLKREPVKKG